MTVAIRRYRNRGGVPYPLGDDLPETALRIAISTAVVLGEWGVAEQAFLRYGHHLELIEPLVDIPVIETKVFTVGAT